MRKYKTAVLAGLALLTISTSIAVQAGWTQVSTRTWSTYTQTKYPIVLVHGLLGFDSLLGVIDYWYQIGDALAAGGAKVYVVTVAPVNSNEVRGEQLLQEVQEIVAASGAPKVNLIGHSQGAPTARYVAGVRPDLVASVTSVDGVNKGSAFADALTQQSQSSQNQTAALINAVGGLIDLLADGQNNFKEDAVASAASLTTAGSLAFNQNFPAGVPTTACGNGAAVANGIHFYSWSGGSVRTNLWDISDALLATTASSFPRGVQNDGLVSTCSSHLGVVIRDNYNMNHLDAINQVLGLDGLFVNPVELYRQQANRLKNAGL